jgi:hypothetical protein
VDDFTQVPLPSVESQGEISPGLELRNQLIRDRRAVGGKKAWKEASGYHRDP